MEQLRKPFQGTGNIIRFNWHFYVTGGALIILYFILRMNLDNSLRLAGDMIILLMTFSIFLSLLVSAYIYDFSNLYEFSWLDKFPSFGKEKIVNIHAGFDEVSNILQTKFHDSELVVLDFYDPYSHTEISIKRARKAYPSFPNTSSIKSSVLPLQSNTTSKIFTILSAHEIRNNQERISFFKELKRILSPNGKIFVMEHLRNLPNILAYNLGALHFHSRSSWINTFHSSNLRIEEEIKINPFITLFILDKNGTTS